MIALLLSEIAVVKTTNWLAAGSYVRLKSGAKIRIGAAQALKLRAAWEAYVRGDGGDDVWRCMEPSRPRDLTDIERAKVQARIAKARELRRGGKCGYRTRGEQTKGCAA